MQATEGCNNSTNVHFMDFCENVDYVNKGLLSGFMRICQKCNFLQIGSFLRFNFILEDLMNFYKYTRKNEEQTIPKRVIHELQVNKGFKQAYGFDVKQGLKENLDRFGIEAMQAEENYYDLGVCVHV